MTCFNISIRFESQTKFCIFLVTNTYIYVLHQRFHDRLCFLLCPQFLTEVQVHRNSHTVTFSSLASQTGQFSSFIRNSRSNTRPVEPVSTFHYSVKIKIRSICFGNRRVSAVIDYFARTHRSSCFKIIDTYAITTTGYKVCFNTIFAQSIYGRLTNFVFRQFRYEVCIVTIICTTYSNVSFTTTVYNIKRVRLNKTGITRS